jgi:hypothetical protein
MNYKKLQIVPSERLYLRISATGKSIPDNRVQREKFILFVFMDLRALMNSRHPVMKKKGFVEILTIFFSTLLLGYGT